MKKKSRIEVIREMWDTHSYQEIASAVKCSVEAVRKAGRRDGLPPRVVNSSNRTLSPEQEFARDSKVGSLDKRLKSADSKYKFVAKQNAELQAQIDAIKVVSDANSFTIPKRKNDKGSATAVAVASDWHWAESVHFDNVNGLNEFNTTIAKQRAENFFRNIVKLTEIFREHSQIDTLVLALLGDFINGELREESMQNNGELVMDEVLGVYEVLMSGIKYILDNTELNLVIPCHSGNHGRITKKIHVATEAGNSLEYMMYHMLARHYKSNSRVKFIIPTSYSSFLDVNGFIIRFHHGHFQKYNGGVAGIFLPVKKKISQWNKARHADLDVMGHFHQVRDGGDFICNGSLVGWNEFAFSIGADYEQPKQVFFLVDHFRKEKTVVCPVFLE